MKKYEIEDNMVQTIANYMATKPYKEVVILLTELSKLQEIKEVKKEAPKAPEAKPEAKK